MKRGGCIAISSLTRVKRLGSLTLQVGSVMTLVSLQSDNLTKNFSQYFPGFQGKGK
jgi:hypothetical protein